MADDADLPWFQTAAGAAARAVVPPWERDTARSRRRKRRHPELWPGDAGDGPNETSETKEREP